MFLGHRDEFIRMSKHTFDALVLTAAASITKVGTISPCSKGSYSSPALTRQMRKWSTMLPSYHTCLKDSRHDETLYLVALPFLHDDIK